MMPLRAINPDVSILVLVDLALEYKIAAFSVAEILSFNPCFSGSCIGIGYWKDPYSNRNNVSILVLVDLALE